MHVGEYIKKLRIEKGLSQEELGKVIGVQRAAVQKWESGKTQNLKRTTIQKLSEFFEVSPILFISEINEEDKIEAELRKKYAPLVNIIAKELMVAPAKLYNADIINIISKIDEASNKKITKVLSDKEKSKISLTAELYDEISELSNEEIEIILELAKRLKKK